MAEGSTSIEYRCLAYCYTKLGRSISIYIYIYIEQCTYTHGRWTPSIKHRCLEYHYTKLGRSIYIENNAYISMADWPPSQSGIDALHTTTPNLADLYIYICVISVLSDWIYPPQFQMKWTTHSTVQMRSTLRSDIPPVSDEVNNSLNFSDEVYPQIRYSPPVSDEVNNSLNFSDEVHTEAQSWNEFIFSDEVFMCSCCIGNMTS